MVKLDIQRCKVCPLSYDIKIRMVATKITKHPERKFRSKMVLYATYCYYNNIGGFYFYQTMMMFFFNNR